MRRGIGEFTWVQRYIGIPYKMGGRSIEGVDCYGLVKMVYAEMLEFHIPDWLTDDVVDLEGNSGQWEIIKAPIDMCIVRTRREGVPDHLGLYVVGLVLQASQPHTSAPSLATYLANNPNTEYGLWVPSAHRKGVADA